MQPITITTTAAVRAAPIGREQSIGWREAIQAIAQLLVNNASSLDDYVD